MTGWMHKTRNTSAASSPPFLNTPLSFRASFTSAVRSVVLAANTRVRRLGFVLLSSGSLLFVCGFALWCNASYLAKLFDLDDPHGVLAFSGFSLFVVGAILYSGLAERLASWINSGK